MKLSLLYIVAYLFDYQRNPCLLPEAIINPPSPLKKKRQYAENASSAFGYDIKES